MPKRAHDLVSWSPEQEKYLFIEKRSRSMYISLYSIEELPTGKISIMARPRGGDWLLDEARAMRAAGVDILVSLLTPQEEREFDLGEESACCHQQGITFLAFPILDRRVPSFSASTFTFLDQLHAHLSAGMHIALHCRQGLGRAVLMAAGLLVLSGFPPDQAFNLLSNARGCPVPETAEQQAWIVSFFQRHKRSSHSSTLFP